MGEAGRADPEREKRREKRHTFSPIWDYWAELYSEMNQTMHTTLAHYALASYAPCEVFVSKFRANF